MATTATPAERDAATRRIYWELQRTYFDAYSEGGQAGEAGGQGGARQVGRQRRRAAEAAARRAGRGGDGRDARCWAAAAEPRLCRPGLPSDLLPPKYRSKGLRFTKEGYPDFAPHAKQLPNGKNHVEIEYTGSRRADFAAANKKAKLDKTPEGWTWHAEI